MRSHRVRDLRLAGRGVRGDDLRSEQLPAPVTFVTSQNQEIAKLLRARGVPISREAREISRETGESSSKAIET